MGVGGQKGGRRASTRYNHITVDMLSQSGFLDMPIQVPIGHSRLCKSTPKSISLFTTAEKAFENIYFWQHVQRGQIVQED